MTKDLSELHKALFSNFLEGVEESVLKDLAKKYVDKYIEDLLNPKVYERLKNAQKMGHHTMILSATPDFIVEPISNYLNVSHFFATNYLIENGRFKAVEKVLDSQAKLEILSDLQKQLNISQDQLVTFSDSYHDLSFLKASKAPVVVNPDKKLRKECKKFNWEII